ncbi:MAG: hypothetical protein AAFO93_13810, partial [Pseudomonadota bacterium]
YRFLGCLLAVLPTVGFAEAPSLLTLKGQHGMYRLADNTFGAVADGDYERDVKFFGKGVRIQDGDEFRNRGTANACPDDGYAGYAAETGVVIPKITDCVLYIREGRDLQVAFFKIEGSNLTYNKVFGVQRGSRLWVLGPKQN